MLWEHRDNVVMLVVVNFVGKVVMHAYGNKLRLLCSVVAPTIKLPYPREDKTNLMKHYSANLNPRRASTEQYCISARCLHAILYMNDRLPSTMSK